MPFVPLVAVEIPAEVPSELAAVTVHACDTALGAGRCALASSLPVSADLAWSATVALDPLASGSYRIDLRPAFQQPTYIRLTRTLSFEDNEVASQRWSTIGVVVAALVVSAERSRETSDRGHATRSFAARSDASDAPPATKLAQQPSRAKGVVLSHRPQESRHHPVGENARAPKAIRIALGGTWARGGERETSRFGVSLRPSLMLSKEALFWSSLGLSGSNGRVSTYVWSGAVGLGFATDAFTHGFGLECRLGLRGDWLTFHAVDGSRSGDDSRLRWGPVAGVDFSLALSRAVDLWVGADGALLIPRVLLNVGDSRVGEYGSLEGALGFGLRVWFDWDAE